MKLTDIPRPKISSKADGAYRKLYRHAPEYLRYLIEKNYIFITLRSLDEFQPGDITLLGGGLSAVTYLVRKPDDAVVVKFDYQSIRAEAEALEAWSKRGANVVGVKSRGTIPGSHYRDKAVKYIILEGLIDGSDHPASTAIDYAIRHPQRVRSLGREWGRHLAIMHGATTKRTFGEFADMPDDNHKPYRSWNAFLMRYVDHNKEALLAAGYTEVQVKALSQHIREVNFPRTGRYLHGDVSLRNALIEVVRPLRLQIIDPNPLIGHPGWDLAIVYNNRAMARARHLLAPDNEEYQTLRDRFDDFCEGLILGYKSSSKRKLRRHLIEVNQMVQMIFQYQIAVESQGPKSVEATARRQVLDELMARVIPAQ